MAWKRRMAAIMLRLCTTAWLGFSSDGADRWVPGDHATIQQAIDAARTGDVIHVAPGIYYERLTIDGRGITLIGAGGDATVVDGMGGREVVYLSGSVDVRLSGFTFRNGSVLVYGERGAHTVLEHNTFQGAEFYGVQFSQSRRGATHRVEGNHFLDNGWGLYSLGDWGLGEVDYRIIGNRLSGNRHGIWLDSTARVAIKGNLIAGRGGIGLLINWNDEGSRVERNVITNCGVGLQIVEQDDEYPNRAPSGRGTQVYHNTLDGNGIGLSLNLVEGFRYDVANNIIHGSTRIGVMGRGPMKSVQFRHNDVFSTASLTDYAGSIGNRAGWHGNLAVDPQFENPEIGDYRLKAASPCIDAGTDVGYSFSGQAPDMGAYEWEL